MKIINHHNKSGSLPKFIHKEFGSGKNEKPEEKLYPCKVFLGKKGRALLIPKDKKIRIKPQGK